MNIQELKERREEILAIAQKHGACHIRVFGSIARGEAQENSDVDFLIDTNDKVSAWFPIGFVQDLEDLLGRKVDVATEETLHWYIRDRILSEAIPL